jgi:hypothetical protein
MKRILSVLAVLPLAACAYSVEDKSSPPNRDVRVEKETRIVEEKQDIYNVYDQRPIVEDRTTDVEINVRDNR